MSGDKKKIISALVVILLPGLIYFKTLSPTVSFIDSGELATACYTLGIAHPTGYPVYTLIGRIVSLIPLATPILRLNFLSLLFICFANLFLFYLLTSVLELSFPDMRKSWREYLSLAATLVFSFSPTLWSQATSNEVYGLTVFLATLLLYLILSQFSLRKQKEYVQTHKILYLFFFLYGLGFGNHLSILLLLPGFLFIFFAIYGKSLLEGKKLFLLALFFLLGLSIYLYLPIRSSHSPLMNWGDPSTFSNLKRHISGWQYRVWMFSESKQMLWDNFKNYLHLFYSQFPFYLLPWIILGFFTLLRRNTSILLFQLLIFLFDIFYGINYEIGDIDPYFLPSFIVSAIWLGCGIAFLLELFQRKKERLSLVGTSLLVIFTLFPFISLWRNYSKQDESKAYFAYDYAENILKSVKEKPIILTKIWDHYSPWIYLRYVENKRPDVRFFDTELSRRSWYLNYIQNNYPELYSKSEPEIDQFRQQVYLFENGLPYDPNIIEKSYVDMIQSFLLKNYPEKPLYCDFTTDDKFLTSFIQFPEGLVFRLQKELGYYPYPFPEFELRGILDEKIYKDGRTLFHLQNYPLMIKDRIQYLLYFKQDSLAQNLGLKYQEILTRPTK